MLRLRFLRVSILTRILAVLIGVVVAGVLVTNVLEAQLTTSALEVESRQAVQSELRVLSSAFAERESTLELVLRAYAERIFAQGLVAAEQRNALEGDLGRMANTLRLDLLVLTADQGSRVAGTGPGLDLSTLPWPPATSYPRGRLVAGPEGYLKVMAVPVGFDGLSLVAGYAFDDSLAYRLRRQMGTSGEVVLVAGNRVAGTTLARAPEVPPGLRRDGELPAEPTPYEGSDGGLLVAYSNLSPADSVDVSGAVGVALVDPVSSLNSALASVRLLSSLVLAGLVVLIGWALFRSITRPLVGLSRTAQRISEGDLDASFTAPRDDEIGTLARSLQKMTLELKSTTAGLQEAAKRVMAAQQEERRRLARDLHDGMQQRLVGLAMRLRRAETALNGRRAELSALAEEAEDAAFALQEIGRGIYPSILADQGLAAALRSTAARVPMAVSVDVDPEVDGLRLGTEVESSMYFVALEAINNVQKHASDARVRVSLSMKSGTVSLSVADDGPGFDPRVSGPGSGLQGIADRIRAVGGTTVIDSEPGRGTTVILTVPADVKGGS